VKVSICDCQAAVKLSLYDCQAAVQLSVCDWDKRCMCRNIITMHIADTTTNMTGAGPAAAIVDSSIAF